MESVSRMEVHTNLVDCHLYLFKKWVLDLVEDKKISSVKNDLLPYLVAVQFKRDRAMELGDKLWEMARSKQALAHEMTSPQQDDDRVKVFAMVLPFNNKTGGAFSARADSLGAYAWISFALLEHPVGGSTPWERFFGGAPPAAAPQQQRSPDTHTRSLSESSAPGGAINKEYVKTLVGDKCFIHPTAMLNRCIVGDGCRIGAHAKLSNCILLKDVEVKENCVLQNSLLGAQVVVGKGCGLNKVFVGYRFVVGDGRTEENKVMAVGDEGGG
jgi:translation initiation factor eIF-2B subunit gamma